MATQAIYKIESTHNGKFYIGSAKNFVKRKRVHIYQLRKGEHGNKKLQRHVNKYGIKDLVFEIIEDVKENGNLIEREQYYIDRLKPFFNICLVAGSREGTIHSDETRAIMRAAKIGYIPWNKGRKLSEQEISKMPNNKGRKASEETRRKMSNAHKGINNWSIGFVVSDSTKDKISKSMTGKNTWSKGREFTEEHKKNLSEARKKREINK